LSVDLVHVGIVATGLALGGVVRRALVAQTPAATGARGAFLGAVGLVGGTMAAKAPFVLADPASWTRHDAWFTDGRTLLLGLAGGYLAVEAGKRALGVRDSTGDGFAAPVATAVAVGRLSCFHSGCCSGVPTGLPWGVDFGDGVPRHPTQLYEAAFHALAAIALVAAGRGRWWPSGLFQLYLLAYAGFRFASEPLRGEPLVAGLTLYQWAALPIGAAMAAVSWSRRPRRGAVQAAPVG
jgi:phosphatidylglycerol:prolipoprotein diacylglycerol transferase